MHTKDTHNRHASPSLLRTCSSNQLLKMMHVAIKERIEMCTFESRRAEGLLQLRHHFDVFEIEAWETARDDGAIGLQFRCGRFVADKKILTRSWHVDGVVGSTRMTRRWSEGDSGTSAPPQ